MIRTLTPGNYIPGIDGLRAISILAVMLYHFSLLGFGWIGVQLFFVISGFLITKILLELKEKHAHENSGGFFKTFYARRALRIFPVYVLYLAFITLFFLVVRQPKVFTEYIGYALTYTVNISRIFPNYVATPEFAHLWSLSIEEQFYVVWPFVVFLLTRRALKYLVVGLIFIVPLLRLGTSIYLAQLNSDPFWVAEAIYNLTPLQLDGFAMGALLTLAYMNRQGASTLQLTFKWRYVALYVLVVAAFLGFTILRYQHEVGLGKILFNMGLIGHFVLRYEEYAIGFTLINLGCALVIIGLLNAGLGILSHPWLDRIGKVSYGMYVFHTMVLLAFLEALSRWGISPRSVPGLVACALFIVVTYGVPRVSFTVFESQFLKLKDRFT